MEKEYIKNYNSEKGNCSTVIIGKNASITGKVIMGHNEDDEKCIVQTHLVPRIKHEEGEVIYFADGKAVIPQVSETYAYYWSEVRTVGGISFADCFVNEWGVAVATNSCRPSKDSTGSHTDNPDAYGIGYGLRRLVAERAKNAREGVAVLAELVEKFGYFSSRSYQVADKDEAWVVQIPKGYNIVAKKVADDEIYYIPNWFTIHNIDFDDKDQYYCSPNIISHAIENGWYTPDKEGDFSDFDFAKAYQEGDLKFSSIIRSRNAWRLLKNVELDLDYIKPFSMKADRKYSSEDVKKVLRCHYEGTTDDETDGYRRNPHRCDFTSICNDNTIESVIIEFNEDINLTRMLRAATRPCTTPYVPWYPVALTRIPNGYEFLPVSPSQASHFSVDKSEFKYDPTKSWWIMRTINYFTEFDYKGTHEKIHTSISNIESEWEIEKIGVENAYKTLKNIDISAAKEMLTAYTCAQAEKATDWAKDMIVELGEEKIKKNCEEWK